MIVRTKALLAAAAALTVMSVAMPAALVAKDKADKDAAKGPTITAEVRTALLAADPAIKAGDLATADTQIAAAAAAAKTDYDRYWVERLKLAAADARKDNAAMAASLDALLANPSTPVAEQAEFAFSRGVLASNMKQTPQAIAAFRKARDLGLKDPAVSLRLSGLLFDSGDNVGGSAELDKAIALNKAAGTPVPEDWYKFGLAHNMKAKQLPAAWDWGRRWIAAYPTPENWHTLLENYRQQGLNTLTPAQQDAASLGLFRLMRATGALSYGDYLNYTDVTSRLALGTETVAVIDDGRRSGKVPASDADANRVYASATARVKADGPIANFERDARAAKDGKLGVLAGNSYLAAGNAAKAVEMFKLALQKGGVDAAVVTLHLGVAQAQGGDTAGATATFNSLAGGPMGEVAKFWLAKLAPAAA